MKQIAVFLIRIYQILISPLFPSACRFYPSCSEYMANAITKYGLIKGFFMGARRLCKCHPFHPGGYDPVN